MTYWLVAREHSCVNHKPGEIPTERQARETGLGFTWGTLLGSGFWREAFSPAGKRKAEQREANK